jgi:hypothetical protein
MSFRPNVHDKLTLNGVTYRIAEHLAAPGWIFRNHQVTKTQSSHFLRVFVSWW